MKAKIVRGTGFGGCSRYLLQSGKGAEIIGGNLTGQTAQAIAEELRRIANQRPDIEKPVWHSPLSAAPGERYSDEKWNVIADEYLQGLGFNLDKTAYIVVRHSDKPHDHVHIESSRVMIDGTLYLGKNENLKATKLTQLLEIKHGLIRTKGPIYDIAGKIVMPDKTKLRPNELRMQKCTGEVPPRQQLQAIILTAVKGRPTQQEFEKRLTQAGVSYKLSSNGYSYQLNGIPYKGSQLGKAFKWAQLQKSFTTPEQLEQQTIYSMRNAAWEADQKRRIKYRANRSFRNSICQISYSILPHPMGQAIQFAVELLSLFAKINDWREANIYRNQVKELTARMNRIKATRFAEKSKVAQVQVAPVQKSESVNLMPVSAVPASPAQSVSVTRETKTNILINNQPLTQTQINISADPPAPTLTAVEIKLLGQANWEMLRYGESRRMTELLAITHPSVSIDVTRKPCPILVNGIPITEIEDQLKLHNTNPNNHKVRHK